ncbi:MAG: ABC transporter ATP-binding protein/permease [Oscillospiraceae bacterium]|nr:ABC transporter ATP-binding protein/permease [Oscillospiraceae bacterium]
MIKLARYFRPFLFVILACITLLAVQAFADLSLPNLMSRIVNEGVIQGERSLIINIGLQMIGLTVLGASCVITVGLLASRMSAKLAQNIRGDLFRKVTSFSGYEFDKFSSASLITRTTNDITQIQSVMVFIMRMVFYAPIMGTGGVVLALSKSRSMSWIIALTVVLLLCTMILSAVIVMPRFKVIQSLLDRLNLVTRENLTGLMVTRAYNAQEFEEERFDKVNAELANNNLFINRTMAFMMPFMMFVMNGVMLLIIWIGSHQIAQMNMQVGDMMAFMQYTMQIAMSFMFLAMLFIMLPRASVSAKRIAEVLDTDLSVCDPDNPIPFTDSKGHIEFENVSFRFPGAEEDTLHNISFTAEPGKVTAIIGPTGSGKSTVMGLVPRFYDVTSGRILIDGIDIRSITQHDLRDKIGFISQKSILFSGTVQSNLKYGNDNASDDVMIKSAEIAQAEQFISEREDGYDSAVSQGGGNLSGGQKQRISIARALVKSSPVCIFDDSFSALDFKTDSMLRKSIRENIKDTTIIIVAQRIGTIMDADSIIVLDEGRIAGRGTHAQLMQTCTIYSDIAKSQM